MSETRSGLFTPNEFRSRGLLRLAPDAFVSINGALGARILSPVSTNNLKGLEIRGGVTSINVNLALNPPGSSKATFTVVAPQYKGLHEDYYINLPNGVKMPFFTPMMEVKIYMKGRFLDESTGYVPQYYPVFWGMITNVSESYSGGANTFTISCSDILTWWKYQKITINPAALSSIFGAPTMRRFPTVFENMTPWEVIYALFLDTFFVSDGRAYNFIYPKLSTSGFTPDFGGLKGAERRQTFTALSMDIISYWNKRFGFGLDTEITDPDRMPLEMFGLQGPVSLESVREAVSSFRTTARSARQSSIRARLTLDYGMLSRIQPYGAFDLFGDGSAPTESTKLEIANQVCEQTHMEFFLDSNGRLVFKPPLYNLDVNSETVPYYVFKPEDVTTMSLDVNGDAIVNYLEVTAPMRYEIPGLENIGYHIDVDSIKRFGIRFQSVAMRYGNDARTLRLIACAEMTRINGRAYTGSLSTPLRPELRLGYPIYVKHLDSYFYVTSISHSVTFGTSATTDIGLEFRRDRMWDDGTVTGVPGTLLKAKVLRYDPKTNLGLKHKVTDTEKTASEATTTENTEAVMQRLRETIKDGSATDQELQMLVNDILKEDFKRVSGVLSGPPSQGFYKVDDASIKRTEANATGDHIVENEQRVLKKQKGSEEDTADVSVPFEQQKAEVQAIVSNELIMVTDDTAPFSDRLGYRHIGAFPYGANLKVTRGSNLVDTSNPRDSRSAQTNAVIGASGTRTSVSTSGNTETASQPPNTVSQISDPSRVDPDKFNIEVEQRRQAEEATFNTPNPDNNPNLFHTAQPDATNVSNSQAFNKAVQIQVDADAGNQNDSV
jgi:hypothetical protein